METIEVRNENPAVQAPVAIVKSVDPVECPTCVSGVDPSIGGNLFQEALHEGL